MSSSEPLNTNNSSSDEQLKQALEPSPSMDYDTAYEKLYYAGRLTYDSIESLTGSSSLSGGSRVTFAEENPGSMSTMGSLIDEELRLTKPEAASKPKTSPRKSRSPVRKAFK